MKAVLDACVLYPTVLREILIGAAGAGLYTPIWSVRLLGEWRRAAARLGPEGETVAGSEIALLTDRFPAAMTGEVNDRIADLPLPDPADAHVIAAALNGGAALIVTANLSDFPRRVLLPLGLTALHPDAFLLDLWRASPDNVGAIVATTHARALAAGGAMTMPEMMKRARLPRLAKALTR